MYKIIIYLFIFYLSSITICAMDDSELWPDPGDGNLKIVHPAYDIDTIHPTGFDPYVSGLDFLSDGRLVICTYPDPGTSYKTEGDVYILDNLHTGNRENIEVTRFATGFAGSLGLTVVDDVIYVRDRQNLHKLVPKAGELAELVGIEEPYKSDGHPSVYDVIHRDGVFYTMWGKTYRPFNGLSETNIKTGEKKFYSTGFRNPDGIAFGPEGEIFTTDQQGNWLPANKLIHVKKDRFYGYYRDGFNETKKETPPALYLPQGEGGLSPTGLVFVEKGRYAGQMFMGDMRLSNITRGFLEKVNGEYQGAAFLFSGGFESGPHRLKFGPDGHLYVGCIGGTAHYTWNWRNQFTGLQRLRKNGKEIFEMIAVRSLTDGFEIEFSEEVNEEANDFEKYVVLSWGYTPTEAYGGPKIGLKKMTINAIDVSADKKKVTLKIDSLIAGKVINIKLIDYKSLAEKPVWTAETWYTLNAIGPAAVVGCLDTMYNEYNPNSTYDDGVQCKTVDLIGQGKMKSSVSWFQISGRNINIKKSGEHRITVRDIRGKPVMKRNGWGHTTYQLDRALDVGVYVVELKVGGVSTKRQAFIF
ncbi:MAG: hypothetical protein HQK83_13515 [Fibrobacteria bacterium]|nr:hypothetical protein [Fibrobacteria bacterium]